MLREHFITVEQDIEIETQRQYTRIADVLTKASYGRLILINQRRYPTTQLQAATIGEACKSQKSKLSYNYLTHIAGLYSQLRMKGYWQRKDRDKDLHNSRLSAENPTVQQTMMKRKSKQLIIARR